MPAFGAVAGDVGLGAFDARDADAVARMHREHERDRMYVPEEPDPIRELSEEQRVFIFNVGPWSYQQSLASFGTKTIPGLEEDKVFKNLSVAGPLVIDGLPSELYPAEGEAKRIYHRPLKNRGRQSKRPGLDFAMEVIGCGLMVNPSCDLRNDGVFISEQREQKDPGKNGKPADIEAFQKWAKDVKKAQQLLRDKCAKMCQDANVEHSRGKFADIRTDKLYQAARLIDGNELQYSWLKDTGKGDNKGCWSCGMTLKGFALKCSSCGEMQVTQAEFDAEKKRRADATL